MDFSRLFRALGGKASQAARKLSDLIADENSTKTPRQRQAGSPVARAGGLFSGLLRRALGRQGGQASRPGAPGRPTGQPARSGATRANPGAQPTQIPPAPEVPPSIDQFTADLLYGRMHLVTSSNVHSIGMQIEQVGDRSGTLYVRYLGGRGRHRAGPGSLYAYYDVPVDLYRDFLIASSNGIFVWDNLRVRGTIAGHRYSYDLVGIVNGYVPRQAAIRRGQPGQWYLRRRFTDVQRQGGQVVRVNLQSQLPDQLVTMRGPNPERGPGIDALRFTN